MNGDELKKLVPKWAAKIGSQRARKELILLDLGLSTAEALVSGRYASTPKAMVCEKLRLAMKDFIAELEAS